MLLLLLSLLSLAVCASERIRVKKKNLLIHKAACSKRHTEPFFFVYFLLYSLAVFLSILISSIDIHNNVYFRFLVHVAVCVGDKATFFFVYSSWRYVFFLSKLSLVKQYINKYIFLSLITFAFVFVRCFYSPPLLLLIICWILLSLSLTMLEIHFFCFAFI